jgi:hypothetical protein
MRLAQNPGCVDTDVPFELGPARCALVTPGREVHALATPKLGLTARGPKARALVPEGTDLDRAPAFCRRALDAVDELFSAIQQLNWNGFHHII